MVAGSASGTSQAAYAGADAQRRYDIAYQQCMYAKGQSNAGLRLSRPRPAAAGGVPHLTTRPRRPGASAPVIRPARRHPVAGDFPCAVRHNPGAGDQP